MLVREHSPWTRKRARRAAGTRVSRAEELADVTFVPPDDLLLSAITGVPPELVGDPTDVDYEALLDDPRMEVRENPDRPGFLLPACDLEGTGFAVPARRIVEAVRGFGESGVVQSICEPRFDRALRGITDRLGELIRRRACR